MLGFLGIHLSDVAVTALATLVGVAIGALIGGAVEYRLERRREQTRERAAARVMRMEFAVRKEQLESAVEELVWWPFIYDFSLEEWDRYRDLLAGALDTGRWLLVSQAAIELQGLGRGMLKLGHDEEPFKLSERSAPELVTMRANLVKAYNALGPLADETELLSADDPPEPGSKPYRIPKLSP
jgi:hypothetical protein